MTRKAKPRATLRFEADVLVGALFDFRHGLAREKRHNDR